MAKTARERIDADETSSAIYEALLERVQALDGVSVEEKSTSFHLVRGRAIGGVHPRRGGLLVTIVLDRQIDSERLFRADRVSANRWHNEVLLTAPSDLDDEFEGWLTEAYARAG